MIRILLLCSLILSQNAAAQQSAASLEEQMRQQVLAEFSSRQQGISESPKVMPKQTDGIEFLGSLDLLGHTPMPVRNVKPVVVASTVAPALPTKTSIDQNLMMPSTKATAVPNDDLYSPSVDVLSDVEIVVPNKQVVSKPVIIKAEVQPTVIAPNPVALAPVQKVEKPKSTLPRALALLLGEDTKQAENFDNGYLPTQRPQQKEATVAAEHYLYAAVSKNTVQPIAPMHPVTPVIKKTASNDIPVAVLENNIIGDEEQAVIEQVIALQQNYGGELVLDGASDKLQQVLAAFDREGVKGINVSNRAQKNITVLLRFPAKT